MHAFLTVESVCRDQGCCLSLVWRERAQHLVFSPQQLLLSKSTSFSLLFQSFIVLQLLSTDVKINVCRLQEAENRRKEKPRPESLATRLLLLVSWLRYVSHYPRVWESMTCFGGSFRRQKDGRALCLFYYPYEGTGAKVGRMWQ